jgi:hypothetical protein
LNFSRHNLAYYVAVVATAVIAGVLLVQRVGLTSIPSATDEGSPTGTTGLSGPGGPQFQTPTMTRLPDEPPPSATAVPAVVPASATATSTAVPTITPRPTPAPIYLPDVPNGAFLATPTATPTETPVVAVALGPTDTPPPPTPTRGPVRVTKLGLGVYESGGGMLPILDQARPSVILLMDPSLDFAREVHRRFPKAFIVGRIFAASEPLDNPAQRGTAFADLVAGTAVPLKGVVDAWMSYNEIGSPDDPSTLVAYNAFQVAFAHRLQDVYGIAAVAGNDGPRAVPAELYPRYYADAIRTSRYFGVHVYANADIKSLRDPNAADQVFFYRKIHAALDAAGIQAGPFIFTEVGLYNGWRGVESDHDMGNDFTWLADQVNNDPYVLGMTVFGMFANQRWANFNVDGSAIPQIMGDYNTVHS